MKKGPLCTLSNNLERITKRVEDRVFSQKSVVVIHLQPDFSHLKAFFGLFLKKTNDFVR